jgi:hypothetical protein
MIGRQGLGGSSLTTAELRVLPLLATHLSFREIDPNARPEPMRTMTGCAASS